MAILETETMDYHVDNTMIHNGARYWFKWTCGFAGGTEFEIREPNGATFRADLQHTISDYWREQWRDRALPEIESRLGLLVRGVCDNGGEIFAETIDAFNAWRLREYERQMSTMCAQPHRYGAADQLRAEFPAPTPVAAGHWTKESGWRRVERQTVAA